MSIISVPLILQVYSPWIRNNLYRSDSATRGNQTPEWDPCLTIPFWKQPLLAKIMWRHTQRPLEPATHPSSLSCPRGRWGTSTAKTQMHTLNPHMTGKSYISSLVQRLHTQRGSWIFDVGNAKLEDFWARLAGHHASLIGSAPLVRQLEEDNCRDPEFEEVAGALHLDE